jgi:adenine-specific DNA-methyltransferase
MLNGNIQLRSDIQAALAKFGSRSLADSAQGLFAVLGYSSDKVADFGTAPDDFIRDVEEATSAIAPIQRDKIQLNKWKECAFLFQLTNDEIPSLAIGQQTLVADKVVQRNQIESFVFLAIALQGEDWSRTDLATITRELNKRFPMPAIILFRHGSLLSLAVIDRRLNKRDSSRDVIESRISVIKDIRFSSPHSAHTHILSALAIQNLGEKHRPTNFRDLYKAWINALSIQTLNKNFYTELFYWYLYAVKKVHFPKGGGSEETKRNSVAVIRLLTRLIFIWFIKEKGLVPDELFDRNQLRKLLKVDPTTTQDDSSYYLAVLQNLFFATLNVEMGNDEQGRPWRRWAGDKSKSGGQSGHYLIHSVYRHKGAFNDPDAALCLYGNIPFLNGGLFECLDRELTDLDFQRNPDLKKLAVKEGNGWVLRIDGFSRRPEAQPIVPNRLFFGGEPKADLNEDLKTSGKSYEVHGLIDIFNRYKFTVDENTPVEEEVALDPELLGKVFENLLASYNDDTKTTARKQTGSFYTPREVVDYMVDEALIAYFERGLTSTSPAGESQGEGELTGRLRRLLSYADETCDISDDEKKKLIAAIESLTILDPACGSGAFPMGALAKLVHLLKKLDRDNILWRVQNRAPLEGQLREAGKILDPNMREDKVEEAEAALAKFDRDFSDANYPDYTRKLYLIEKCIHGVDIQPIAVQIAKLRFFISLIVSQKVDDSKENRNITALPNLETKIVAADSLTPIDRPEQMLLRDPAIGEKEKELAAANEHYFAARTGKTKRKWRDRIFTLRDELAGLLEKDCFLSPGAARQLVHWDPFNQNAAAGFFDPEWMFQLNDGFDIVIGNPPYVRQEEIKEQKPMLKEHYDCFTGTADLFVYFYERSIKLLKPHGAFAFITSNKWYRAKYGEKLRDWMNRNTRIRSIIDFGDEAVFTAIAYPTIIVATKRPQEVKAPPKGEELLALNWSQEHPVEIFPSVFASEGFSVPLAELKKDGWQLEPPSKRRLLEHIRSAGKQLGEYVSGRFYYGIKTGLGEAFVVNGSTRCELINIHPSSADIIKPFLRGRDVKRWHVEFADQYLIKIESSENKTHPWSGKGEVEAEKVFAKCYPAIHAHFQSYRQAMINRSDKGQYFWELRSCAYWKEFDKPKIILGRFMDKPTYAFDDEGYFHNDALYLVSGVNPSLIGILNSTVNWWFLTNTSTDLQNGYLQALRQNQMPIPIPEMNRNQETLVSALVQIMRVLVVGHDAVISYNFERLLNGLVFELFFHEDLHKADIRLFAEAEKAGVGKLATLEGEKLINAANEFAGTIFSTSHPIYRMLFDLQGLDVVRIIEGKD